MHENKLVDIFSSLIMVALSIVLYVSTFSFRQMSASKIGSDFLPQIVAIALFILSIIMFINAFVSWKKERKVNDESIATKTSKETRDKPDYILVLISLVLMAIYLVLIPLLGFLIATAGYLFIQIYLISPEDKRSPIKFAIVSIVTSAFVYYIFKNLFYLMLPSGILG